MLVKNYLSRKYIAIYTFKTNLCMLFRVLFPNSLLKVVYPKPLSN